MSSGISEVRELKIPVPWGYVAARDWGDENGTPVLALHGWLDNAGTFDTLIPLIDKSLNLRIIAIDIPGHGFSSHVPQGSLYHYMDSVTMIMRVIQHFGWNKVSCMGHSLGAGLISMFASLFPEKVESAIFLDFVKPVSVPLELIPDRSKAGILGLIKYEEKMAMNKEFVYSKEEAKKRLLDASTGELTEETAGVMLKRGTRPSKDGTGYVFTRDLRLRVPSMASFTLKQHLEYLQKLCCPLLVIMANDHSGWEDPNLTKSVLEMYQKNCEYFEYKEVSGGHHFHLNVPNSISGIINNYFHHVSSLKE